MIQRGDVSTGWSMAWKVNWWAKMLDGNHAYKLIQNQLTPVGSNEGGGGTYNNLFDAHPPFQIDGNFGGTAGIAEMLLQSHEGYIDLLPALPDQWPGGNFRGLCIRGGGVLNLEWEKKRIKFLEIAATVNNNFKIKIPDYVGKIKLEYKNKTTLLHPSNGFIYISLLKGERAKMQFE